MSETCGESGGCSIFPLALSYFLGVKPNLFGVFERAKR